MKVRRRAIAEINVVPYIDVMLVLLVIFMITTPLLTQGVKVELPKATAEALTKDQQEPIIISVDKDGHYYLNVSAAPEKAMSVTELTTEVAAHVRIATLARRPRMVLVKGDQAVPYAKVVNAMVLLNHAGVKQVGLMTQSPEQS